MTWTLVTAPDERERCCIVQDGARCARPTRWLVGDMAGLDYACVCDRHLELVRRPGDTISQV